MDLAQNTIRWMRTYDIDTGKSYLVEALSLKPDATALAVYSRELDASIFAKGSRQGYLFVIDPADGGHITT